MTTLSDVGRSGSVPLTTDRTRPEPARGLGVVRGAPRVWLRLEGVSLLAAAVAGYAWTQEPWWLFAGLLLAPDLSALGYMHSRAAGALIYNLAHAMPVPAALVALGLSQGSSVLVAVALTWLAHIGMDRAMDYGLKYSDDPGHTHLGWHGPTRRGGPS